VAHLAALPPRLDQAGALEHGEVLGDGLPRQRQRAREHRRRRLTAVEQDVEHAAARGLAHRRPQLVLQLRAPLGVVHGPTYPGDPWPAVPRPAASSWTTQALTARRPPRGAPRSRPA